MEEAQGRLEYGNGEGVEGVRDVGHARTVRPRYAERSRSVGAAQQVSPE